MRATGQNSSGRPRLLARDPQLGAAYYNEYLPDPGRLARDMELMREAGITLIRVGESVWSTWEPTDGRFDLEWLQPVLDAAAGNSIDVILGTPTYAVPPWLANKHPELAIERVDGASVRWGARQEVDFTSPVFRTYAERLIRNVLARYGRHEAVVGIQVDNEPGLHLIANSAVVARFVERLRGDYDSVEHLNEAWGLAYWSHRISTWDELWHPGGNTTPAYDLAWRRFQADLTTEFIAWQADIARQLVPEDRFITTCIAYNRAAVDDVGLGRVLDVVSGNAYLEMQDALGADASASYGADYWFTTSPAGLIQQADRMRSSQGASFLVTETGATSIAGSHLNFPPYDGQLAQVAWALIARGATLVEYWHWHTLHHGAEQAWGGILGHDLEPGRTYREIAAIGAGLAAAGESLRGLQPQEDVGFLFSRESRWAMQFQPPLAVDGSRAPDRWSYDRIVGRFVEAAFDAGLQTGVLAVEQLPSACELLDRFPILVVAGASVLSDDAADVLCAYAEMGGTLVLGIRSGAGDQLGRARVSALPGPFRSAAGVSARESSNLRGLVPLLRPGSEAPSDDADGAARQGTAEAWADALELEGAQALLGYDDPHLGRWAAVAENSFGAGRVVSVGTLPDRATLANLLRSIAEGTGADGILASTVVPQKPGHVTVHGAVNAAMETIWFLHNWSAAPVDVPLAAPLMDLLDPARLVHTGSVQLAPWGVRVFIGRPG
ncbi:beta-galactosidase [Arthrobacter sp. 35W]|uniref:beta-galactosidase n=1 Tax=Arthrobacter sp. 35W TaxID=1132441 RepID=UPI000423D1F0|nr:beta-galactosidase [Arthrobacter sp. 35W]